MNAPPRGDIEHMYEMALNTSVNGRAEGDNFRFTIDPETPGGANIEDIHDGSVALLHRTTASNGDEMAMVVSLTPSQCEQLAEALQIAAGAARSQLGENL